MPYTHLTRMDRAMLYALQGCQLTPAQMAGKLGRHRSTIGRELRRNLEPDGHYNPNAAQLGYWDRRQRLVKAHKVGNQELMDYVVARLKQGWSPEQIAGRLRYADFPDKPERWISHETIYRYVWADKAQGGKLYTYLRRGRKKYGKRGMGRHPNAHITGRVSIDDRPAVVDQQTRVGDWEGDTFFGRHRRSCLATVVERKTLYTVTAKMPDCKAESLNCAILNALQDVPKALVHTLTVDNGKEFARFKRLEQALDAKVYFTHPYSAWQRGINENTNGLLRQYLPRKTDLRTITANELEEIAQRLNNRPRKKLEYRTPAEVFWETCVALDG